MAQHKGHAPSRKRLDRARREGQVLKSPHLSGAVATFVTLLLFLTVVGRAWVRNRILLQYCWSVGFRHLDSCSGALIREAIFLSVASLGAGALAALAIELLQVGFRVNPTLLAPRTSRLISGASVMKVFLGRVEVLRVTVLCLVAFGVILSWSKCWLQQLPAVLFGSEVFKLDWSLSLCTRTALWGGMLVVLLGAVDYGLQRRKYFRELSMSADELRRETKEDEGDPNVRAFRRSLHQALIMQDLVSRVRKARVIVVEQS